MDFTTFLGLTWSKGQLLIKKNTCPFFKTRQVNQLRSSKTHLVYIKKGHVFFLINNPTFFFLCRFGIHSNLHFMTLKNVARNGVSV